MAIRQPDTPAESTLRLMKDIVVGCDSFLRASFNNAQNTIWHNQWGLTPAEVFAVLAKDGGETLAYLDGMRKFFNSLPIDQPLDPTTPDGTVVITNPDGTVTVS